DNMNNAIRAVSAELGIDIGEFTVGGFKYENRFAHRWYIGTDDHPDPAEVRRILDETLSRINDDYAVERTSALKEVFVEILPNDLFIKYLRSKGKEGAMHKFPRVMKNGTLSDWETFLSRNK